MQEKTGLLSCQANPRAQNYQQHIDNRAVQGFPEHFPLD
jgi:hypothetical protein